MSAAVQTEGISYAKRGMRVDVFTNSDWLPVIFPFHPAPFAITATTHADTNANKQTDKQEHTHTQRNAYAASSHVEILAGPHRRPSSWTPRLQTPTPKP